MYFWKALFEWRATELFFIFHLSFLSYLKFSKALVQYLASLYILLFNADSHLLLIIDACSIILGRNTSIYILTIFATNFMSAFLIFRFSNIIWFLSRSYKFNSIILFEKLCSFAWSIWAYFYFRVKRIYLHIYCKCSYIDLQTIERKMVRNDLNLQLIWVLYKIWK